MALVDTDFKQYLTGGASNNSPVASLGGATSTTEVGEDIFDTVLGKESLPGDTEYRCIIIKNTHATLTGTDLELFFNSNTVNPNDQLAVAIDSAGLNGTPATVADEDTSPSGVTFSQPIQATPLILPDLGP